MHRKKDDVLDVLLTSLSSKKLLELVIRKVDSENELKLDEVIKIFQEVKGEISVPLSIFSANLHPAEALSKYLKENKNLTYKKISEITSRDKKSVWGTYHRAVQKRKQKFMEKKEAYYLPISIFKDRSYSLLENAISYVSKVHHLSNKEIAKLLNKSPNSIAVLMKRAKDKHEQQ